MGAGSMHPETLVEHIRKCKAATDKPFGVNIPIMYPEMDKAIEVILREGVKNCIYFSRKSSYLYFFITKRRYKSSSRSE